jgi:hypothetical protein
LLQEHHSRRLNPSGTKAATLKKMSDLKADQNRL